MDAALLVVLGAVAGAVGNGGVNTYLAVQERRLRRKVAARLIAGDLYVLDAAFEFMQEQ